MSAPRHLDGRRTAEHLAELRRRAVAVLSGDGTDRPIGTITGAIFGVAARIAEEVSRRLDEVPAKQAANFYAEAGIGRDPARPARLTAALKLSDSVVEPSRALRGTRLMAEADGPVIFETAAGIDLVPGAIVAVRGLDAEADAVSLPADAFAAGRPPRRDPMMRRLASAAAAGATKLQIDPAAKLDPGMLVEIGDGAAARQHKVVKVEGSLVTIEPPLEAGFAAGAPAVEAAEFAPFAGATRNQQAHALYLAHAKLLEVPSGVDIHVAGADLPAATRWSWWGAAAEGAPPGWQELEAAPGNPERLLKGPGKPAKKNVNGHESLWLRAVLPGESSASSTARDVTLAIGGAGCGERRDDIRAPAEERSFDAIANTTPLVVNRPFHPFGREPRLYDSFYLGSDEAFSKAGAEVSLRFDLAGPALGPLAGVALTSVNHLFGVGTDGLLYRFRLRWKPEQPTTATGDAVPPISRTDPDFRSVAPPQEGEAPVYLQSQSPVAAWQHDSGMRVAAASTTKGVIQIATSQFDDVRPDAVKWTQLKFDSSGDSSAEVRAMAMVGGTSLYVLFGKRLFRWDVFNDGTQGTLHLDGVSGLAPLASGDNALALVEGQDGLGIRRLDTGELLASVPASEVPSDHLRGHLQQGAVLIAGYDQDATNLKLVAIAGAGSSSGGSSSGDGVSVLEILVDRHVPERVPVTFSRRQDDDRPPLLSLALDYPLHIGWREGEEGWEPVLTREPHSIGCSSNSHRSFVDLGPFTYVQRPSEGLLYRAALHEGSPADHLVEAADEVLLIAADIPGGAQLALLEQGDLYRISDPSRRLPAGDAMRLLEKIAGADTNLIDLRNATLLSSGPESGALEEEEDGKIRIEGSHLLQEMTVQASNGTAKRIWKFVREASGDEIWPDAGFELDGDDWSFVSVRKVGEKSYHQAIRLDGDNQHIADCLESGSLWIAGDREIPIKALHRFDDRAAVLGRHDAIVRGFVSMFATPPFWEVVGPDVPANPALSWEYWNGASWWALAAEQLVDGTRDLQKGGVVFFHIPADLAPTDVAGKKSHWIRARLVGGDYGEARVTVTTVDKGGGKTEQVAKRDTSSIRAPYVTSLRLGYCALDPVRPEIVLTEDNLGFVDQTSANEAGLEFPVFVPVAEAMNPRPVTPKTRRSPDAGGCEEECVDPAGTDRDPCSAAGAYDSCDSPCVAEPGRNRPPAAAAAEGFVRGLMIGLDRPFLGNSVSFYFEAAPGGPPELLIAEILRDGRFVRVRIAEDGSHGLTESGIVTLAMPASPDGSDRLGASAHWLRLRPKLEPSKWSPRLRGIHLNAVAAESIETRRKERIGSSDGTPGQTFRLAEAPVSPKSLELRVRELLDDAERNAPDLDVAAPEGMEGDWVLWRNGDPESADDAARVFGFDAESGTIRFGDGRHGRIPPLGAELMAVGYAKVHGARANGVAAGAALQPVSPLAGVESVLVLEAAAGGTDAETVADGVRRAAAKVRHGDRLVSLADIEEYAATLVSGIEQVRAERRRGAVRLIVVGGREGAGWRRQMGAQIAAVAGYGVARPGGLEVVGPRYLELGLDLDLEPAEAGGFADAAKRAADAVAALLDPGTGGHSGTGWPLGRVPDDSDVAAALAAIEKIAIPTRIALFRIDRKTGSRSDLPPSIPSDVLVRLDPESLRIERAAEAAA